MYQLRTLILITPALIFYEVSLFGFLLIKKRPADYFQGMFNVMKQVPEILKERKKIQNRRILPDRDFMGCGDIFVYSDEMSSILLKAGYKFFNGALSFYWRVIRNAL
jgi:hypothetical protein